MTPEKKFWQYIRGGMTGRWHAVRIENLLSEGVPDFTYAFRGSKVTGWIELKVEDKWPVRPGTPLRLKRFTPAQNLFLRSFGASGSHCWVLLRVEKDFLLFDYSVIHRLGKADKTELYQIAWRTWTKRIDWDEFTSLLKIGQPNLPTLPYSPLAK